jgi:hypothetical protein
MDHLFKDICAWAAIFRPKTVCAKVKMVQGNPRPPFYEARDGARLSL